MSLFRYSVLLADGTKKTSSITAKTKEAAMVLVAKQWKVKEWHVITEEKKMPATTVLAANPSKSVKSVPAKMKPAVGSRLSAVVLGAPKLTTKLDKLLYLQSNKCFFCKRVLTKAEASIEHLQPKSGGGKNDPGNVVVCCKSLNSTFGNISLKRKFEIVLEKAGNFTCPVS